MPSNIYPVITQTVQTTETQLISSNSNPLPRRFIITFPSGITGTSINTTLAEFSIGVTPVNLLQMVTPHGGNVRMDMLANALMLRRYGRLPYSINCYSFRCSFATDPDRVIVWDCLPTSSYVATTTSGTNTTDEGSTTDETVIPDSDENTTNTTNTVTPALL